MIAAASGRRRATKPRPEERVDDHVVAVEVLFRLVRDVPGLAKQASGNSPVASVRAASADACESPRPRKRLQGHVGNCRARRVPSAPGPSPGSSDSAPRPRASRRRCRAARSAQSSGARAHDGDRGSDLARVRHREVDRPGLHALGERRCSPRQPNTGLRPPDDLDLLPREPHAAAERLPDGFLAGEPPRIALAGRARESQYSRSASVKQRSRKPGRSSARSMRSISMMSTPTFTESTRR